MNGVDNGYDIFFYDRVSSYEISYTLRSFNVSMHYICFLFQVFDVVVNKKQETSRKSLLKFYVTNSIQMHHIVVFMSNLQFSNVKKSIVLSLNFSANLADK